MKGCMEMLCAPTQVKNPRHAAQVDKLEGFFDSLDSMLLQMGRMALGLCSLSPVTPSQFRGQEAEQANKHEN